MEDQTDFTNTEYTPSWGNVGQQAWAGDWNIGLDLFTNALNHNTATLIEIVQDQKRRAIAVVNDILQAQGNHEYDLMLLDGHGRMTWCILNIWYGFNGIDMVLSRLGVNVNLQEENTNRRPLKIILAEIGENQFKYHYRYLRIPGIVQHVRLGDALKIPLSTSIKVRYYNFTSLGDQVEPFYEKLAEHAYHRQRVHWSFAPKRTNTFHSQPPQTTVAIKTNLYTNENDRIEKRNPTTHQLNAPASYRKQIKYDMFWGPGESKHDTAHVRYHGHESKDTKRYKENESP